MKLLVRMGTLCFLGMLAGAALGQATCPAPTTTVSTLAVTTAQQWQMTWCNPSTTGSVDVYRANSPCATASVFSLAAGSSAPGPWASGSLPEGTYCFYVVAKSTGGLKSVPSNELEVSVTAAPPEPVVNVQGVVLPAQ